MERFFDILFSGLALLALSPLLVPVVIVLKFSGEGEIFFFQERIGKDGKLELVVSPWTSPDDPKIVNWIKG